MKFNLGSIFDSEKNRLYSKKILINQIISRYYHLKNKGIKKEENVIIGYGNNFNFFVDLFAIWKLSACAICIDNTLSNKEILNIINLTKSKYYLYEKNEVKFKDLKKKINFISTLKEQKLTSIPKSLEMSFNSNKNALILFTSGTTGSPKGVVHSFYSLSSKWIDLKKYFNINNLKNTLCLLPTHFGHGLICNCLFPLINGNNLYIFPKFSTSLIFNLGKIIDKYKITYMSSVPTLWRIATAHSKKPKKNSLKLITCGSAPLSEQLWKKIQVWTSQKKVWNTYGITETGSWIAGTSLKNFIPKDGFIGKQWGSRMIISETKPENMKTTKNLRNNKKIKQGYIWVKTRAIMEGYYKKKKLTSQVIKNNWFFTGDIGIIKNGNLTLVGRERNEINVSGIKVIPEDVDMVLEKHKFVDEACTFSEFDKITGEKVVSAVVLSNKNIKEQSLINFCKKNFSDHKLPKKFYFLKEIPKTSRGKINRDIVKDFCLKNMSKNER